MLLFNRSAKPEFDDWESSSDDFSDVASDSQKKQNITISTRWDRLLNALGSIGSQLALSEGIVVPSDGEASLTSENDIPAPHAALPTLDETRSSMAQCGFRLRPHSARVSPTNPADTQTTLMENENASVDRLAPEPEDITPVAKPIPLFRLPAIEQTATTNERFAASLTEQPDEDRTPIETAAPELAKESPEVLEISLSSASENAREEDRVAEPKTPDMPQTTTSSEERPAAPPEPQRAGEEATPTLSSNRQLGFLASSGVLIGAGAVSLVHDLSNKATHSASRMKPVLLALGLIAAGTAIGVTTLRQPSQSR